MEYGCIAKKLSHSYSADIHALIGDYNYILREVPEEELDLFMRKKDFLGINVTIPYKKAVMPYLDDIDPAALRIGSVNTVVNRSGRLFGYNTDYAGMRALIKRTGVEISGKKVLILGTGGTSATANVLARDLGARQVLTVSRREGEGVITYKEAAEKHSDSEIIINTTPAGMFPDNFSKPLDIEPFARLEGLIDAVFNPNRTRLVLDAQARGIKAAGGLFMLVAQAVYAAEHFFDKKIDETEIDRIYREIIHKKENIGLTGMPASGKSTIGRLVADILNRDFYDCDAEIEKDAGMKISEIFEKYGENHFRDIETETLKRLSMLSGVVISTGGGAILRDENVAALRQNSKVFFLDRDINWLKPTSDRPTASDREAIKKRYEERYPKYLLTADEVIKPGENAENNAKMIVERFLK